MSLFYISSWLMRENIITKLPKLYSSPRNLRAGNKSPVLNWKKSLCTGDLSPTRKIFIERPVLHFIPMHLCFGCLLCIYNVYVSKYYTLCVYYICILCMVCVLWHPSIHLPFRVCFVGMLCMYPEYVSAYGYYV